VRKCGAFFVLDNFQHSYYSGPSEFYPLTYLGRHPF